MSNKVTIIGAGSFGTAIANIFSDKNYEVLLYTINDKQASEINELRTNEYYFEDFKFTGKVGATTSLEEALKFSKYVVIALPSSAIREIAVMINSVLREPKIFINVSKGLEPETHKMLSEIIEEEIDESNRVGVVVLSGPSHAEEIIKRHFTALVAVSLKKELGVEVQRLFSNNYIRVYTSEDLIGVQIASTVKNVLALASGIVYGMGYGDNTRAALITRGLSEMARYGVAQGAVKDTFFGLTGIGDLVVTATSYHSRNFQTGLKIGEGMSAKQALIESKTVVEGVRAADAVYRDAKENGIDMPITEGVYRIFFEEANPDQVMKEIVQRELKAEKVGI